MAPFAIVFMPVGVWLLSLGVGIVQDQQRRARWTDMNERRRALVKPLQRPYTEQAAVRDGYVIAALGVAFVVGGLSLVF